MKRQITCLLAVCMLSALLCGCGRSEKQTAGTKPAAPVQTAAATEAPGAADPRRHSGYQNDDPVLHGCGQCEFRREI